MSVLLSVVMPTHDRAREVGRAAASVLAQDVENLELVIVDDSSSDETPAVLDRLVSRMPGCASCAPTTRWVPVSPRNRGLEVASGELVAFCDDDDAWFPGIGGVVVDFLADHPDVVAASSWHVVLHAGQRRRGGVPGPAGVRPRPTPVAELRGAPLRRAASPGAQLRRGFRPGPAHG